MNILIITILILIQRAIGSNLLTIPLIAVYLFNLEEQSLPKFSFIVGLILDLVLSYSLGVSSLLLLLLSFEVSRLKTQLKSENIAIIFTLGVFLSVQANIVWQSPQSLLKYVLQGAITVIIYLFFKNFGGIRNDGVYLKK